MSSPKDETTALEEAVRGMQELKAEHRPLLDQIASDPGMQPETRRALIAHVLEEEDEKLASIAQQLGGAQAAPGAVQGQAGAPGGPSGAGQTPPSASPATRARVSVGSLRTPEAHPVPTRGSIGSLRGD